jgi:acyl-coenzyme A synthetase/AMP-(fatty) acid ligase
MSHRNSAAAIISMLQKTGCHRVLTTPKSDNATTDALVDAIRAECPSDFALSIECIPHADEMYPNPGSETYEAFFNAYPSKKRSSDDTAIYLHSSGSTGFPKAIALTFKTVLLASNMGRLAKYK